jgi:hypothetical protein
MKKWARRDGNQMRGLYKEMDGLNSGVSVTACAPPQKTRSDRDDVIPQKEVGNII